MPISTPVLDDFNRANGSLGASWTDVITVGDSALTISSNQVTGSGTAFCSGYWNVGQFGARQEAYVTVATKVANTENCGVYVRLVSPGTAGVDGYYVETVTQAGTDQIKVFRIDNGVFTTIGSTINQEWTAGDILRFYANGSVLQVFVISGGVETQAGSDYSDTTYQTGGYIGMDCENTTGRLDSFGGGTVPARMPLMGVG